MAKLDWSFLLSWAIIGHYLSFIRCIVVKISESIRFELHLTRAILALSRIRLQENSEERMAYPTSCEQNSSRRNIFWQIRFLGLQHSHHWIEYDTIQDTHCVLSDDAFFVVWHLSDSHKYYMHMKIIWISKKGTQLAPQIFASIPLNFCCNSR